jgi:aryl-alcohol dehydrogenase-like predicted oxidoreductase
VEREVVPAAAETGLGLLPWSPLGRGVLAGRYRGEAPEGSRATSPAWSRFVAPYLTEHSNRVVDAVHTAAEGLRVSMVAVALAWVRDRPGVVAPVVGARTAAQLSASLESESLVLPSTIRDALDDVSAPTFGYPERWHWG